MTKHHCRTCTCPHGVNAEACPRCGMLYPRGVPRSAEDGDGDVVRFVRRCVRCGCAGGHEDVDVGYLKDLASGRGE